MEFLKVFISPIGLAIIVVICGTVLALAIMKYRINASKETGLTLEKGDGLKKKVAPHANCSKRVSGMDALRRTMEFTDHREELRNSILEQQMDYYEEKEEEIKNLLKKIFGNLLKEKYGIEDYSTNKAYNDFNKTLYIAFGTLKKSIRKWYKNNHYDKLEAGEQLSYVITKKEIILDKIAEELTFNWFQEDITRKEFADSSKEYASEFEDTINRIFSRAFLIARETHAKIRLLEINYTRFVKDTFGEDAVVLIGEDYDEV